MKQKIKYIPTLQEYVKKRKKSRTEYLELNNCSDCDYYRRDIEVCIWGNNVKILSMLRTCPITYRVL